MIPIPPSDLPDANACTSNSPGPRQLRRLSASEFTATVRDLFRDPNAPNANIFTDQPILGFTVDSGALLVQDLVGDALRDYAETVAAWAVANKLSQIASCTTMDATCRRQVISSFGKRAFRAPLPTARVDAYDQIFAAEATFAAGVEATVAAMLQSPYFLYRTELGPETAGPGATVTLTPHEVASSLSYLLAGSDARRHAAGGRRQRGDQRRRAAAGRAGDAIARRRARAGVGHALHVGLAVARSAGCRQGPGVLHA